MNGKHIEINIGKACNSRCRFCMSAKPEKRDLTLVPFEVVCHELEQYQKKGYNSVGFLGGDISIHPELLRIVQHAKKLGYTSIHLTTNAMVFDSMKQARDVVQAGVTRINISIHSHIPEVEDFLTRVPGGLKRKLQAIQNFNTLRAEKWPLSPLSINLVLNKQNYQNIIESCHFFHKYCDIHDIRINFVWPTFDVEDIEKDIALRYTEAKPVIQKLIIHATQQGYRLTFDTVPPCIFRDLFPDNFTAIVKKFSGEQFDTIDEISSLGLDEKFSWKEKKRNRLKYQGTQCWKCLYADTCDGPWREYVELFGFREFVPIPKPQKPKKLLNNS